MAGDEEIVGFADAQVGQSAYTWENGDADWGEYKFETVDPQTIYTRGDFGDPENFGPLIRKRWVLAEVTEIIPFPPEQVAS